MRQFLTVATFISALSLTQLAELYTQSLKGYFFEHYSEFFLQHTV